MKNIQVFVPRISVMCFNVCKLFILSCINFGLNLVMNYGSAVYLLLISRCKLIEYSVLQKEEELCLHDLQLLILGLHQAVEAASPAERERPPPPLCQCMKKDDRSKQLRRRGSG